MAEAASGTDGQYRMTVDAKYQQTATARKGLRLWAMGMAVYNLIRSVWHTFPWTLYGQTPPPLNIWVMVTGLFAYMFYLAGSGFGNPRDQSRERLFIFGLIAGVNAALVGLAFIFYHLQRTRPLPHLTIAGTVISNWKAGHSKDPDVHAILWMAETIFDVLGMGASIEAAQRAIKYVLATGTTKAKTS